LTKFKVDVITKINVFNEEFQKENDHIFLLCLRRQIIFLISRI